MNTAKRDEKVSMVQSFTFLWRDFCRVKLLSKSVFSGSSTHFSGHGALMQSSWRPCTLPFACQDRSLLSSCRRLALGPIRPWCPACSHLTLHRERRHFLAFDPGRRHLDHRLLLESVCCCCCERCSVESLSPSVSSIEL